MSGLIAAVRASVDGFGLDVALHVAPGEVVAVLGPNGAGKTTLLRVLAGLLPLDAGRVGLDGTVLDDPLAGAWVPPEGRPVGVVFQDGLLFPQLSALENVAFGLRARGTKRTGARATAGEWLARVGLADRAGARPSALSGGQAQRVALARALAASPRLLLLDEPLSALDATTRVAIRHELRRHLAAFEGAAVLVTHDPVDAMSLADRLVILESGHVTQAGPAEEVVARPRSRYAADLAGVNLFAGRASGGTVAVGAGTGLVVAGAPDGDVLVVIHPRAVALHRHRPDGTPRNVWEAPIGGIDEEGDRVRVRLAGALPLVAEVTAAAVAALGLAEGESVWAAVKATEATAFPA